mmetsp:Transcript_131174/g.241058  ORF Transcript_131174/g.241058 Transcript_131174/m.241058 type:complete len:203 (-) Transcript_131174:805-1413(-)
MGIGSRVIASIGAMSKRSVVKHGLRTRGGHTEPQQWATRIGPGEGVASRTKRQMVPETILARPREGLDASTASAGRPQRQADRWTRAVGMSGSRENRIASSMLWRHVSLQKTVLLALQQRVPPLLCGSMAAIFEAMPRVLPRHRILRPTQRSLAQKCPTLVTSYGQAFWSRSRRRGATKMMALRSRTLPLRASSWKKRWLAK